MIEPDSKPFGEGPVQHLDRVLMRRRVGAPGAWRRAMWAFAVSWPPLVVLSAWQGVSSGEDLHTALLRDFLATARYAIAAPLLALAESFYVPRMCRIHREFIRGGFVAERDRGRFARFATTTGNLLGSTWMEVALVTLAYVIAWHARDEPYRIARSDWNAAVIDGMRQRTWAGWWMLGVSHPLFLVLVLRSLVRLCAWTGVLWKISRLDLRLIPAHADLAGGLRFVTTSVYALLPLAFTFGVLMAARATQGVIVDGLSPWMFRNQIVTAPIVALVVFAGPLLVFERQLWRLKVQGTFDYGVLATRVGRRFEERWLREDAHADRALDAPDFSATTDLFSIVSNVRNSRLFLLDASVVVPLLVAALLPFVPLLVAAVPADEMLTFIWRAVV